MGKCSFEYPVDIISDTLFLDDDQKEEHCKREYALICEQSIERNVMRLYLCQHADFAVAIATADYSRTPQLLILLCNMTIAKKVSNVLVYCQLYSNSAVFRNSHLYRIA